MISEKSLEIRCGLPVRNFNPQAAVRDFARFAHNRFPAGPGRPGTLLVCSQPVWRRRCRPLLVCSQCHRQTKGGGVGCFVEAIDDQGGRSDALEGRRQRDRCCKAKNPTILGKLLAFQPTLTAPKVSTVRQSTLQRTKFLTLLIRQKCDNNSVGHTNANGWKTNRSGAGLC